MSMLVRRPSPYDELLSLRQAVDRLFDSDLPRPFFRFAGNGPTVGSMPLDVRTDADSLTIEASLPGIRPEDVEITVEGGTVTLSASSQEEHTEDEGSYLLREIRRGAVTRSIALPEGLEADRASATFENGLLRLRIPRAEQVKPHRITISPTTDATALPAVEASAATPATTAGNA
jgi:HSP20 family protein